MNYTTKHIIYFLAYINNHIFVFCFFLGHSSVRLFYVRREGTSDPRIEDTEQQGFKEVKFFMSFENGLH